MSRRVERWVSAVGGSVFLAAVTLGLPLVLFRYLAAVLAGSGLGVIA